MANLSSATIAEIQAHIAAAQNLLDRLVAASSSNADDVGASALETTQRQMIEACRANGHKVTFNNYVDAKAAAYLLGLAPQTLRNDRGGGQRIPFLKVGKRVLYAIKDLAEYWMASSRDP